VQDDVTARDEVPVAAPAAAPPTVEIPAEAPLPAAAHDGGMTRSEEQLVVGTERVATTRARLVKYVVTEEVQITVPIRREEIRVEQVPVDAPDDLPGETLLTEVPRNATTASGGLPDEIVLHTERPVVTVEVVPTERVRLRTQLVQGQETVTEQVQREQIVVDQDTAPHRQTAQDTVRSGVVDPDAGRHRV
jgi:stress response protein YsnF